MQQFWAFVKKEFFHIWRDKQTLLILFGMPVAQIMIFGFALTNEVKNTRIAILDPSLDLSTTAITQKLEASRYFDIEQNIDSPSDIQRAFQKGKIRMAVVFPPSFHKDLLHLHSAQIQLLADASDPNTATTLISYAKAVIQDYQDGMGSASKLPYTIQMETRMLYNPQLKGAYNFVPGVMAMILMLVCTLMTSIAIVREKERGTMEIILASPLKPVLVILAKALPYLLLSMVNIASILLLSVFVLDLPIAGSLPLLLADADFAHGHVSAYAHVQRLYVSGGEYAQTTADDIQYRSGQMVFLYRQGGYDQGTWFPVRLEGDPDPGGHDFIFSGPEPEKIQYSARLNKPMRTLRFLLEKEFRQIFRDPAILRMMFIMPVIQLILLPLAANYEVKNVKVAVVDHDHSTYARQLVEKIRASGYFKLVGYHNAFKEAIQQVERDQADIVLEIPLAFEKTLVREDKATMFLAVNAINGAKGNIGASYLQQMIRDYNQEIRFKWVQFPRMNPDPRISITESNLFNIHMSYQKFMVPGILVILLTMVGAFLTSLNIVKEKEIGTIEQINVTPIRKHHFILGKLIPFWIMGQIVLTLGLIIARIVYGIAPLGNIGLIYLFSSVYLLAVLGLGLLISSVAQTQQQAMLIAFFLMMIFILLGGLYTSIDSMPDWAQWITRFNPVTYFIDVIRMVVLKGSTLRDILPHLGMISMFAVVLNMWAIASYQKRS
jgi:ABC-2 type transport system permease protein